MIKKVHMTKSIWQEMHVTWNASTEHELELRRGNPKHKQAPESSRTPSSWPITKSFLTKDNKSELMN